jgi:hypothetical protein
MPIALDACRKLLTLATSTNIAMSFKSSMAIAPRVDQSFQSSDFAVELQLLATPVPAK